MLPLPSRQDVRESYDKNGTVVVLPPLRTAGLRDAGLRDWLAKSDIYMDPEPGYLFRRVMSAVRLPDPQGGPAALRLWGQAGEPPGGWIAAADPVYLEPQLDQLCLHELAASSLAAGELGELMAHLQRTLGGDSAGCFFSVGVCAYVSAAEPFATAIVPAAVVDQQSPGRFLPGGDDAATFRGLLSEIEMTLHDHPVNRRRLEAGHYPVNSLWLWGGGTAPPHSSLGIPPLFANDPLLLGYWSSAMADAMRWPGSLAECLEAAVGDFVAVTPERQQDGSFLEACLATLRAAMRSGRLRRVTLLFRDGVRAEVTRLNSLRFWRRTLPPVCEAPQ